MSQNLIASYTKKYQIQVEDMQLVELIELKNEGFKGCLINSVWKTNINKENLS